MAQLNPSEGGKARAASLTPEERKDIAIKAAEARWKNPIPKAKYVDQPLVFGDFVIFCAVLEDEETRVISSADLLSAFGREPKTGAIDNLPAVISANNLRQYLTDQEKESAAPIPFRFGTARYTGYRAEVIPLVCKVFLKANAAGKLQASQIPHAQIAEVFFDACAVVGITALVDEATGFQRAREEDDLRRLMFKWVSPVMRPWMSTFPSELWPLIQKVFGWNYDPKTQQRGIAYAGFVDKYIYGEFPKDVHEELKRRAPITSSGRRGKRLHQGLTVDTGLQQLDQQIQRVMAALSVTEKGDRESFEYNLARIMGRIG